MKESGDDAVILLYDVCYLTFDVMFILIITESVGKTMYIVFAR